MLEKPEIIGFPSWRAGDAPDDGNPLFYVRGNLSRSGVVAYVFTIFENEAIRLLFLVGRDYEFTIQNDADRYPFSFIDENEIIVRVNLSCKGNMCHDCKKE